MATVYPFCPQKIYMKIKVVYALPNFNTAGSGKALLNIALGLDKSKFEAHIVCNSSKGNFFKVVQDSGIQVHVLDYIPPSRPIFTMLKQALKVGAFYRKLGADVVHSFHYSDNYSEAIAARMGGAKWVFTKKNMSWGGSSNRGWKLRGFLANGIAVQNTDMIKQFYPNSTKTALIPRGVIVENFQPEMPKLEIRENMNTALDARIIICVANMVPVKGVELLIDAFNDLHQENKKWCIWLVGDINNDYGKELITKVEALGLQNKIHFAGKKANVRDYLDHAEIFVLPTKDEGRREGSPVALLEAMANGKIVIGSAVPGVKDQLKEFPENQFAPGNWESLKEKLQLFMSRTTAKNTETGKQFAAHVKNNFSIELEIERHAELYTNLLT